MPYYDYHCTGCHQRFNCFMSYADYGKSAVVCPHCGSSNVRRKIGRIRVIASEERRMESLGDLENFDGLEESPREMGRMLRRLQGETGEDMGPEFNEVVNRLEKGQSPDQIEKDLPALGDDVSGEGDFFGE